MKDEGRAWSSVCGESVGGERCERRGKKRGGGGKMKRRKKRKSKMRRGE